MANHQKRSSGRQPADSTVAEAPQDVNSGTEVAEGASSPSSATAAPEGGRPGKAPSLNINDLKDMSIQKLTQVAKDLNVAGAEEIDILHLASELVVDAVIQPEDLRSELARRYALCATKQRDWPAKNNAVTPV